MNVAKATEHVLRRLRAQDKNALFRGQLAAKLSEGEPDGSRAGVADVIGIHENAVRRYAEIAASQFSQSTVRLMRKNSIHGIDAHTK
jgi:hypothetical protein